MKIIYILTFVLIFSAAGFGQSKKASNDDRRNIRVIDTQNGATAELLPISVTAVSNLRIANIGLKYFGIDSERDVSFVIVLAGTKPFYKNGERYGVKFYADDALMEKNYTRGLDFMKKERNEEVFRMFITTEELAWLAGAEKVSLGIFDVDTDRQRETLELSPAALGQFRAFAKSVYLMRSAKP